MAAHAPNPRIRATLTDMARTWTRLALEAEQTLKENRPPLQLIQAAFDVSVSLWPSAWIELRQDARVIEKNGARG